VQEGQIIGAARTATAMIDLSDGLAGDLGHVCERSRVGARVYASRLPVALENRRLAQVAHGDEWHFALHGGEDYELLFTAPDAKAEALAAQIQSETGTQVALVGEILPEGEGQQFVLPGGRVVPMEAFGWDHLKEKK
jgi:thiamine-monophosphate kinase